ncbi:MAG: hypothetical protein OXH92_09390 [Bryobacterales bacterium]|nr:hypothetical protein [Bryobacterales bacterium]MDE0434207.1 hypothetical protein [Bryobacterales bacterium]
MRGLDIDTRNESRLQPAVLKSGKRLDTEARDGARTKAGPVRERTVEIGSRKELGEAIRRETSHLEKSGAVIGKVWGKAELESFVDRKAQQAQRETHDPYAGDNARRSAARELGLGYRMERESVSVRYPEAQIEYSDAAGRRQRLNIDVAQKSRTERGQRRHIDRSIERGERAREKDPDRERISFDERKRQAVTDVATYRVVSVRDLVEERFGGNAFAARKGIDSMKRKGLLEEHTVSLRSGKTFKVLTATDKGLQQARESSAGSKQRYFSGLVKPKELRHDAAVYRAARNEIAELERNGAKVKRVRIDHELKSQVAKATERARAKGGREAAQKSKIEAAETLHLPVDQQQKVHYPDAQIEYEDARGDTGRVNVEVASGNYRNRDIQPKAAAGFALHANGRAAGRRLAAALDPERGGKRGGGGGRKDEELFEL